MAKAEKTITKADFIASLKANKKALAAASKVKAGGEFTTDADIIKKYKLGPDVRVVKNGKVAKVTYGWAKGDKKRPYVSFHYIMDDGTNLPSVYREILKSEKDTQRVFGDFQRLGYDTEEWAMDPVVSIVEAAEELTKDNPTISIALSTWGDDVDNPRLNISAKALLDSDDDEDEGDDDEEDEPKSKKSSPARSEKSSGGSKAKAKAKPEPEDEEDDDEEEDSEFDEDDKSTWIGYECTTKVGKKTVTGEITAYDEDDDTFTVQDEDEEEHQVSASKVKILEEDE